MTNISVSAIIPYVMLASTTVISLTYVESIYFRFNTF
jgi:hypothetical protein